MGLALQLYLCYSLGWPGFQWWQPWTLRLRLLGFRLVTVENYYG